VRQSADQLEDQVLTLGQIKTELISILSVTQLL
jgi:hypothetical protein